MATLKPRYSITVDEELLEQIEDYRFSNRIQTRAEATIALIKKGLKLVEIEESSAENLEKMENLSREVADYIKHKETVEDSTAKILKQLDEIKRMRD